VYQNLLHWNAWQSSPKPLYACFAKLFITCFFKAVSFSGPFHIRGVHSSFVTRNITFVELIEDFLMKQPLFFDG